MSAELNCTAILAEGRMGASPFKLEGPMVNAVGNLPNLLYFG